MHRSIDFKLYLITDRKQTKLPLADAVRLALEGGVRAIQLREKDLPVRDLLGLAAELRVVTKKRGARLFINDRADVAIAVDADGVHLGRESMPPDAVRRIVGTGMLIGVSTHTLEEAKAAEAQGADFITFGPVFSTPSKIRYGDPVGLDLLTKAKKEVKLPVFGLGGIKSGNVGTVLSCEVDGVSLISGIFSAPDIRAAADAFVRAMRSGKQESQRTSVAIISEVNHDTDP